MAKNFVIYKVHIHKVIHEELYTLLEGMPKSTRGSYIRQALDHYARTSGLLAERPKTQATGISFRGTFDEDFSGTV
ncbi:MAG: hypothetical protein ABSC55_20195 [Syntrophorhabdales bacterium]